MPPRKMTDNGKPKDQGITAITVQGFKSIAEETTIEIRPLTILAGANSSGKSSIMQPILMLKQTLEAPYDPGPLMINGPHVKFTSCEQFLTTDFRRSSDGWNVQIDIFNKKIKNSYTYKGNNIQLKNTIYEFIGDTTLLNNSLTDTETEEVLKKNFPEYSDIPFNNEYKLESDISRNRCFFEISFCITWSNEYGEETTTESIVSREFVDIIYELFHIPGVRSKPERTYNRTFSEGKYPGLFIEYVASLIFDWQEAESNVITYINSYLDKLGLNSSIVAKPLNQVEIEILVSRFSKTSKVSKNDLVNIADVGFGVSQVLPVLVALLAAEPGQLVYIEQPELHLHPRAQVAMAEVLVDAAKRGVKVVAETHSSSLLLGIQTAVAEGKISPDLVKLHWFERQKNGITKVTSAELDEHGTFGDWPEDFGDVELKAQSRFLDAAGK